MKKLVLTFILFLPLFAQAEYNGVHIEFKIRLLDGKEILGFKFIAHGQDNEKLKRELESKPDVLLQNSYSFEPGNYGYYQKRLEYEYQGTHLYKLIEPIEIDLNKIKFITIEEMKMSSYAIQIASNHEWKDRLWMNSVPMIKYSKNEDMCSYDVFIHKSDDIPNEAIESIKQIIYQTDIKIKAKERENIVNPDLEYAEQMKELYEERRLLLKPLLEKYKNIRTLIVSTCTC